MVARRRSEEHKPLRATDRDRASHHENPEPYCGSKFALEGLSEVLGKEVKSLGIHVTALAPGQFHTDWAGRSMVCTERSIADLPNQISGAARRRRPDRWKLSKENQAACRRPSFSRTGKTSEGSGRRV